MNHGSETLRHFFVLKSVEVLLKSCSFEVLHEQNYDVEEELYADCLCFDHYSASPSAMDVTLVSPSPRGETLQESFDRAFSRKLRVYNSAALASGWKLVPLVFNSQFGSLSPSCSKIISKYMRFASSVDKHGAVLQRNLFYKKVCAAVVRCIGGKMKALLSRRF